MHDGALGWVAAMLAVVGLQLDPVAGDVVGWARRPRDPAVRTQDARLDRLDEARQVRRLRVRQLGAATDPDFRAPGCRRLDEEIVDRVVGAVIRHGLALEERHDDVEHLVGSLAALGLSDAYGRIFRLVPADTSTEDDPVVGQELERRELLGEDHRVAQRHDEDRCTEPDPLVAPAATANAAIGSRTVTE